MNVYVCRRMKLCSFLLNKGFNYTKVVPDKYNDKYNCWLFPMCPEIMLAVEEYYSQVK